MTEHTPWHPTRQTDASFLHWESSKVVEKVMNITQRIQSALKDFWSLLFPRREDRELTVQAVGDDRKIVALSGPYFPVYADLPCKWVVFKEYPEIRFTSFREDLVPGAKIVVTLSLNHRGEIVDREV